MNDPTTDSQSGWSPLVIGGLAVGVVILVLLIPTFRSSKPQDDTTTGTGGTVEDATALQCERVLLGARDGLQPTRLGISADNRVVVDALNNWMTECLADTVPPASDADVELRKRLLTPEAFEVTQLPRFQHRDADHVRNSLLAQAIVGYATGDAGTDLERAVALFYFVVRTVNLMPAESSGVPLTPYESLVLGIGSAADRTWTYALLLRQLRLDVVMLQPRVAADDEPYWIVGVVIPGEGVALFDPRLGLPISTLETSDDPMPQNPAMLSDAKENDEWFRQYDLPESPYPLTAEKLKTVDVFAIGTSSTWAPRMAQFQSELPEPVELYDGLMDNELRQQGLIDRLVEAGKDGLWSAEQVRVWPYPENHWQPLDTLPEEQQQVLAMQMEALEGPFNVAADEDAEGNMIPVITRPHRTLRRARIEQLMGEFELAQQVYLQSRLAFNNVDQLNTREVQINLISSDLATYWAAQCQFEQGDYKVASESAVSYLRRPGIQFMLPAAYLASLSFAFDGKTTEAATLLAQANEFSRQQSQRPRNPAEPSPRPPDDPPQHRGNQQLIEFWKPTKVPEKEEVKPAPSQDPENKPAAEDKPEAEVRPESKDADSPAASPQSDEPKEADAPKTPATEEPASS